VIDEDEFDGLMAVMISQPTDVLEPQIFSEMIDGVDDHWMVLVVWLAVE
jgi:hypothetical protein